jgi:adenylyltransferase/sulfurtransferase
MGPSYVKRMLIFDANGAKQFTEVGVRGKQPSCAVCSPPATRTINQLLEDYPTVCGGSFDDKEKGIQLLGEGERISAKDFNELLLLSKKNETLSPILIDVREPHELGICALPQKSLNVPYSKLVSETEYSVAQILKYLELERSETAQIPIFVVCRRGNDSQRAVKVLKEHAQLNLLAEGMRDIKGGLHAWARDVDPTFPVY